MRGIMAGFIIGMLSGIMLAIPSFCCYYLEAFINIPVKVIRAVPVASFVILALLWLKSSALSTLISASMVMPIIYSQMLSALKNTDRKMLEFAKEKNLKLLEGYKYSKRDRYRFLGITVMKRFYYYPDIIEYCLLGFIPIYRGKIKSQK